MITLRNSMQYALFAITYSLSSFAMANGWEQLSGGGSAGGSIINPSPPYQTVCKYSVMAPMSYYHFDSTGGNSSSFTKWWLVFENELYGQRGSAGRSAHSISIPTMEAGVKYRIGAFNYYLDNAGIRRQYHTNTGTSYHHGVCREPA